MDTVSKLHAEAPQATASEGLAQGPYVADRAGFEPATLWTKGDESTDESPRPTNIRRVEDAFEAMNMFWSRCCIIMFCPLLRALLVGDA